MHILKRLYLLIFITVCSLPAMAQWQGAQQGNRPGGSRGGMDMNIGSFYGKVVDSKTHKPIEAATVQFTQSKMDTSTHKTEDKILGLTITDKKGEFNIDKLPVRGKINVLITAVGYTPYFSETSFDLKRGGNMAGATNKDLGNIEMAVSEEVLEGVTVTAKKSMLQMDIDRKVFNVGEDLSSAGGTAIDVMKNVPSVSVDVDGNVSLRNKAPQLLVDGRPTTLELDQIPADEIESIEIITNPSAKFDASGGGAGILNVILKKNRKPGYNGNVRANTDTKGSYGMGADLNVRQSKVNFFLNGNFNQRKSNGENTTLREDKVEDMLANFNQSGKSKNNGHFAFGRAGMDYLIDNRNTFSVSGMVVNGKFNNSSDLSILRDTTINSYFSTENGNINNLSGFSFKNYGGTMGFKHNFTKQGHEITADVNFNSSNNTGVRNTFTQYFDAFGNAKGPLSEQISLNDGKTKRLIAQTDYTNPLSENVKIEAGLRVSVQNYSSTNENFLSDNTSHDLIPLTALNSKYKFDDEVYAGYVTYSQQINNFSFQIGSRIESSFYTGKLIDSSQVFSNDFPFSFFPSVFLTQKIDDKQDLQLNYSRKVNRPNFFQLIPYYDFSDSLNISRGNPDLKPEFTNLIELSYQYNMRNGNNLLVTGYYRNTNDLIARYTFRDKNPNPAFNDSIFISSFTNASASEAYGLEITSTNRIASWWDLTTNVNIYNNSINADLGSTLSNRQTSWFGKINSTWNLPKRIQVQLTGDYTSKTILPPARGGSSGGRMWGGPMSTANGYSDPTYGFDISVKKDLFKDRTGSVTLSMNDIFRTRVYKTHSRADNSKDIYSIQYNERIRNPQVLRISFNWRFGKFDTSLFKRKNMKGGGDNGMDQMQGMQGMQ